MKLKALCAGLSAMTVGVCASFVMLPTCAQAQQAGSRALNADWAAKMTQLLKLSPTQQSALEDFVATSSKGANTPGASQEQLAAMSLMQNSDFWAEHIALMAAEAKADAIALRRFYALLSEAQRQQFDQATRPRRPHSIAAADVVESAARDVPDYQQPAHVNPDWLIKPTAENIARVYPSAAVRDRLPGRVTLGCVVDEDGYLTECVVRSEIPKDRGFGNAALEITGYMRMQPATNYGVPVRSFVNVPISFNPSDED